MERQLSGKRIAFLATEGTEQVELESPLQAVREAGADAEIVSLERGELRAFNHLEKGDSFPIDATVDEARAADYDGLVLPGGVINADFLRADPRAVRFAREFFEQGKPVGVICHGPWTLVEADVLRGRTITSFPSLQTDIRNAGGNWVDEQVHVDNGLVSSRRPSDLAAFDSKLVEELAEGRHDQQVAA